MALLSSIKSLADGLYVVVGFLFCSTLLALSVVWVTEQDLPAINADEYCLEFCDSNDRDTVEICSVIIVIQRQVGHVFLLLMHQSGEKVVQFHQGSGESECD